MAIAIMFAVASCNKNADKNIIQPDHPKVVTQEMMSEGGANPDEASITQMSGTASAELNSPVSERGGYGHYLYTESNASDVNSILAYKIMNDGSLYAHGNTASGGAGTGKGLGSQGAWYWTKITTGFSPLMLAAIPFLRLRLTVTEPSPLPILRIQEAQRL